MRPPVPAPAMLDDERLRARLLEELAFDPQLREARLDVDVSAGEVTLRGTVTSLAQKLAAEAAVRRVQGVAELVPIVQVEPPTARCCSDADLAARVRDVLAWSAGVPEGRLAVTVENGWVTLEGEVDGPHQRAAAAQAVHLLEGVRGLTDAIRVAPGSVPADVHARIEAAFQRLAALEAGRVEVAADSDTIVLSGRVLSLHERELAVAAAWSAPGVTRVEDRIKVVP